MYPDNCVNVCTAQPVLHCTFTMQNRVSLKYCIFFKRRYSPAQPAQRSWKIRWRKGQAAGHSNYHITISYRRKRRARGPQTPSSGCWFAESVHVGGRVVSSGAFYIVRAYFSVGPHGLPSPAQKISIIEQWLCIKKKEKAKLKKYFEHHWLFVLQPDLLLLCNYSSWNRINVERWFVSSALRWNVFFCLMNN